MHLLDWILFLGFLAFTVWDGLRRSRENRTAEDYFLAGRSMPWWAMGLSIMATQASAITMIGTTGQGWADGLRFVQFYFALPIAMLILSVTAVPVYLRHRVGTAYEYLGIRFDAKTRLLGALLFLALRGLSVGFVIYAPSLVLSRMFHLPLATTVILMGGVAVVYTSLGGLRAVITTDVKQMSVMILGLVVAFVMIAARLPEDVGLRGAWTLAGEAGRLEVVSFRWDPAEKYTIWSSLLGGLFLFLSYFGTDQSQVQRILSARSAGHARGALLLNALCKVPFQLLVLSCGVLLFAFYLFHPSPISHEPQGAGAAVSSAEYVRLVAEHAEVRGDIEASARRLLADEGERPEFRALLARSDAIRDRAREVRGGLGDENYVFLDFILTYLPAGIVGILLAAVFAAALSSIDSELNSMATVAVLDILPAVRRRPIQGPAFLRVSKLATAVVGAFATAFALYAGQVGSLIEAVNRVGSYLYGSLLGVFILAGLRFANGHGAFVGAICGMIAVVLAARTEIAFLYLNGVGAVVVVLVGAAVSLVTGKRSIADSGRRV